jgi:hypothetical protein
MTAAAKGTDTYNVKLLFLHALAFVNLREMCAEILRYLLIPVFPLAVRSNAIVMQHK